MDEKTLMNELYDSTLVIFGAVGLSMVGLKYAQKKKWIPDDPFDIKWQV